MSPIVRTSSHLPIRALRKGFLTLGMRARYGLYMGELPLYENGKPPPKRIILLNGHELDKGLGWSRLQAVAVADADPERAR